MMMISWYLNCFAISFSFQNLLIVACPPSIYMMSGTTTYQLIHGDKGWLFEVVHRVINL